MNNPPEANWLSSTPAIARYAGVSRRTVVNWIQDGLKVKRMSARHLMTRPEWVDHFIEKRSHEYALRNGLDA